MTMKTVCGTKYLEAKEIAGALDLSKDGVLRAVREGRLPARKIGREYLFAHADVAAFFGLSPSEMAILRLTVEAPEPAPATPATL